MNRSTFQFGPCVRRLLRVGFLAAAVACGAARAAEPQLKIGFVDFDKVIAKSGFLRGKIGAIESKAREFQDRIDRNDGRYQRLAAEIDEQRTVLSPEELGKRKDDLKLLQSETEDLRYQLDKLLRNSRQEALTPALDQAMKVIEELGAKEGFDLIVRGDMALYASKRIDLTDRVIEELDKIAPPVVAPAPAGDVRTPPAAPKTGAAPGESKSGTSVEKRPALEK